jgi:hypothetical protein
VAAGECVRMEGGPMEPVSDDDWVDGCEVPMEWICEGAAKAEPVTWWGCLAMGLLVLLCGALLAGGMVLASAAGAAEAENSNLTD